MGSKKISRKVVELLRALVYDCVTIQVADSTKLADENLLGFGLGEKLEEEKFVSVRLVSVRLDLKPS